MARPQLVQFTVLSMISIFISIPLSSADCPDQSIRCRIPISNVEVKSTEKGWEVGAGASAGVEASKGPPTVGAKVEVNGKYYETQSTNNKVEFIVIGSISVNECYDALAVRCSTDKCGRGSAQTQCNNKLADCRVKSSTSTCGKDITVKSGDTCDKIASANGIALADLQTLNPGKCGPGLQVNQKLCLATQQDNGTPRCEAAYL